MTTHKTTSRISFLAILALLLAMNSVATAQSSFPLYQSGSPVFRPAYLRSNGPQPFSTRRDRELQAMRSKTSSNRLNWFPAARGKSSKGVFQSRKTPLFSRRFGRFR